MHVTGILEVGNNREQNTKSQFNIAKIQKIWKNASFEKINPQ